MFHRTGQNIGDRFDPPMRVPWKAFQVILGPFISEIVKQQKRVQRLGIVKPEGAGQFDTGALKRRLCGRGGQNGTD